MDGFCGESLEGIWTGLALMYFASLWASLALGRVLVFDGAISIEGDIIN